MNAEEPQASVVNWGPVESELLLLLKGWEKGTIIRTWKHSTPQTNFTIWRGSVTFGQRIQPGEHDLTRSGPGAKICWIYSSVMSYQDYLLDRGYENYYSSFISAFWSREEAKSGEWIWKSKQKISKIKSLVFM